MQFVKSLVHSLNCAESFDCCVSLFLIHDGAIEGAKRSDERRVGVWVGVFLFLCIFDIAKQEDKVSLLARHKAYLYIM